VPLSSFQTPIVPSSVAPWTWLSNWIISYSIEIGSFHNTPQSLTSAAIQTFYDAVSYNPPDFTMVEDYGAIGVQSWRTFNEFFARSLIDPGRRPIDLPDDATVIVSPADSTWDGSWPVDENANVTFEGNVVSSKGLTWSISELLKDSEYGSQFAGGQFAHAFLSPSNYHREHSPVAGEVMEAKMVHGQCYLQVVAEPSGKNDGKSKLGMIRKWRKDPNRHRVPSSRDSLDAPNSPGYQFLQSRAVIIIKNPELGYVAVLPMGMAQVSSVVLECKVGGILTKGQEISYFQFGGSDIVLVFQKNAYVTFTTTLDTLNRVGKTIATASPASPTPHHH